MIHESVHAVRDEIGTEGDYDEKEEAFCDLVAGFIQFPRSYVELVCDTINGLSEAQQVNTLKHFAAKHGRSLYGIVKAIKLIKPDFELRVGGADVNLRKQFPTIGTIISAGDDVRRFLATMHVLSENFLNLVATQIESISNRKLAEVLNIDGELDAEEVRTELLREFPASHNAFVLVTKQEQPKYNGQGK